MIYYQEPAATIYQGHALTELRELPDESVDCVITSPPYWGLRTYKTEPIIWGDNHCEHEWGERIIPANAKSGKHGGTILTEKYNEAQDSVRFNPAGLGNFCLKCGAWKGELGLEPTIELYISHLLQIFDEVKRVLKKTGTVWVNIGDSYASQPSGSRKPSDLSYFENEAEGENGRINKCNVGIPAKSLCLIPERFALGMVERGWILRNNIIWYKPNPMPESVKDRFTGTYEYVYFFVKSNTIQYWTNPVTGKITGKQPLGTQGKWGEDWVYRKAEGYDDDCGDDGRKRKRISLWQGHTYWFEQQFEPSIDPESYDGRRPRNAGGMAGHDIANYKFAGSIKDGKLPFGQTYPNRNKRDVWEINTQPYPEAHFAVFPEKLVETPILSGCPSMICKKCGKAREKIYEYKRVTQSSKRNDAGDETFRNFDGERWDTETIDKGYTDCGCNAGFEAGVVLDPFAGSGTTGAVAKKFGRKYIGIELSEKYCKLHKKRLQGISLPMELAV